MKRTMIAVSVGAFMAIGCNENKPTEQTANAGKDSAKLSINIPDRRGFVDTVNGKATDLYVLKNKNGMTLTITNYGGRFVSLLVPDKEQQMRDVVVGYNTVDDFVNSTEAYFGATIGRFGNRI
ncbi:MAG TPA: galactose-1-epimerase, partial [Flavisolibacter sp.]